MKYILDNKSDKIKSVQEGEISSFEISVKGKNELDAKKILIVDEDIKHKYIIKKINKKMIELLNKMQLILSEDGDTSSDAAIVLDESEKFRDIIATKYLEFLKRQEFESVLRKLMIMEEEFKIKYNRKQAYAQMLTEDLDEFIGKSR